ncbi:uncharacterized protein LOC135149663 [Daucus carota subsp. sativus]|uniref:uncharacterized protein LOC135149663 n=1 Tax=Daucus carota subsp. sativus TaxID=79200 RepID=UPI003082D182
MRRSKSVGNFEPDPEIERTFRIRRQEAKRKLEEAKMDDNNNANGNLHVIVPDESSIQDHETPNPANCMYKTPAIGATQYNINPSLIQMVSNSAFEGDIEREDPHRHLERFVQMCGSFRINGVTADQICLHMFPYSIKGKALEWFQQLSDTTLATWDNLSTEFLSKYYPSDKTQQMRAIILTFKAQPGEGLYQAWERYKALLRKCPHHGYEEWMVLSTFYGALNSDIRLSLDVAAGGNFKKAPVTQAKALLEELASNNYAWAPSGTSSVKSAQDTEMMNLLTLKLDALTQEVRGQRANVNAISSPMEGYMDPSVNQHSYTQQFPAEAAFIQGRQSWPVQNNSYYNPNQRPNNNLSYNNNHAVNPSYAAPKQNPPPGFQPRQQYQSQQQFQPPPNDKKEPADWEVALGKMIQGTTGAFANIETKFEKVESRIDQIASSQKMLEMQIGQIANKVGVRDQGSLPSQPDVNVKEHCKAITLRSGRELPEVKAPQLNDATLPPKKRKSYQTTVKIAEKIVDEPKDDTAPKANVKQYVPPIPFPQRLTNRKLEKQYEKFLKMFREIHISIPFADALAQMPLYAKFMKQVLSNRKKLEAVETISLSEECSAVIQRNIPPKLKDPGSFSLPCTIGQVGVKRALCDLGASVSLMPYSIYKRLGLGELKKTKISLQLADRSIKYPLGVLEDVLVNVDKFVIPCDFVILEMNVDVEIPIILGRPFLATGGASIDVKAGKLSLNVGGEKVEFDLDQVMKAPTLETESFVVDIVEELVKEVTDDIREKEAKGGENNSLEFRENYLKETNSTLGSFELVLKEPP